LEQLLSALGPTIHFRSKNW